jgi:hypothetical protein
MPSKEPCCRKRALSLSSATDEGRRYSRSLLMSGDTAFLPRFGSSAARPLWLAFNLVAVAVLLLALAVPATAPAAPLAPGEVPPRAPRLLPGDAAAANLDQSRDTWLVGARPSGRTASIARRFDAKRLLRAAAIYWVDREQAPPFASALKAAGLYEFSEPDQRAHQQSFPAEPALGVQWGLASIGATALTPPLGALEA